MDTLQQVSIALSVFCFGYPFVSAWYWMAGGVLYRLLRERHEPWPDDPPMLPQYPMVSILLPCFNEQDQAAETFGALVEIDYPNWEVIAVDDGSSDRTAEILDELAQRIPQLRVVHLARNLGKSTALNVGALAARGEIVVGIDGDALIDRHALTWLVRRFLADPMLGGLTGNPRIRNRATLLGRLQVGEFSSIIGLIKRAQAVYGTLFTVSGVICAFRKRALADAGWWSPAAITDDVEITWRMQLNGWRVDFEPKALCWILMPETLGGLWRQRLRWAVGGMQAVLAGTGPMLRRGVWRLLPIWLNFMVSVLWSYAMLIAFVAWAVTSLFPELTGGRLGFGPSPRWWGILLALTYILQSTVSVVLDRRFERGLLSSLFWVIWYPLVFWLLQTLTAAVGAPLAMLRRKSTRGTWVSPDRGVRR